MKIKNGRLYWADGSAIAFENTKNQRGKLKGNKPRYIILHYTAGATARDAVSWFKNPKAEASAHLVIGHDGSITQMVKFDEKAWHAGRSSWENVTGLNSYSVGIEIANWGFLNGGWGRWKSWTGVSVPDERVIEAAHRNQPNVTRGWEVFDSPQIDTAISAVQALAQAYGLKSSDVLGHDDISPSRKSDPGPAFDMERFRARAFGRNSDDTDQENFKVTAASGLNMRLGPGIEHEKIKTLKKGTEVKLVEQQDLWWLVAAIVKGNEDETGWVHSKWLAPVS